MMRKAFVLTFLLLANIIILVHTIIPHHHHSDQICFDLAGAATNHEVSGSLHNNDTCCHHDHHSPCTHDHHTPYNNDHHIPCNQDASNFCHLTELMVFHTETHRNEIACQGFELRSPQGVHLVFNIPALYSVPDIMPWLLPFRQKPFSEPNYYLGALRTPGLRAPPAC